ncbi:DedA family protein [Cyclonatronum proteinivorum]|uniref:DedA family protein n=1 Tax=Cyclonatronum proteinivorum TaxID=1457365 RepID=UPI0013DF712E|nr:DedA family protein [Cyclonatronum proteinivorum]
MGIYLILALIAYLENVVPPIPGDILVVFGGYLASEAIISFWLVVVLTSVGSVLGFMTMYYFGYLVGDEIRTQRTRFWFLKYFDGEYLDKAEQWMYRWGQGVVLANRFLAGARSIISIMAGVTRLNPRKTATYALAGAFAWNVILIGAGWLIGDNWPAIERYLNLYGGLILSLIAAYLVFLGVRYAFRKWRSRDAKNNVDNN